MSGQIRTAVAMGLREYSRMPVLLLLLFILPAYLVGVYPSLIRDSPVLLDIGVVTVRTGFNEMYAVLMAVMSGGIIGGFSGLFNILSSKSADGRLLLVGYDPWQIIVVRFLLLAIVAVVITPVALGIVFVYKMPTNVGAVAVGILVATLIYGTLGMIVGVYANRLIGVYVVMFATSLDIFLYQNPISQDPVWVATYLPGYNLVKFVFDAAFTSVIDPTNVLMTLSYLLVLVVLATASLRNSFSIE